MISNIGYFVRMIELFIISAVVTILLVPVHFISVEHEKLQKKFGQEKGKRVGSLLGVISGWGYFIALFGLWLAPQERIFFSIGDLPLIVIPYLEIPVMIINLIFSIPFILSGAYFGIIGVIGTGLQASEYHLADALVTDGIYATVRHPQYLGGMLSHVGMSILFGGVYSFLLTILIFYRDYIICKKEEEELVRKFGTQYRDYQERTPMLIPRRRSI